MSVQSAHNGEHMTSETTELLRAEIAKTDNERQIVFGWASVSVLKDGSVYQDRQKDEIEPDDLESAAYDFVLHSRRGDAMHDEVTKATLVESMVFTPEKLQAFATDPRTGVINADHLAVLKQVFPTGWHLGFHVPDSSTWSDIKKGKYRAFSIGGSARRVPVETVNG